MAIDFGIRKTQRSLGIRMWYSMRRKCAGREENSREGSRSGTSEYSRAAKQCANSKFVELDDAPVEKNRSIP